MAARHFKDPGSGKITLLFPGMSASSVPLLHAFDNLHPMTIGCSLLLWWWTRSPRWGDFLINGKEVKRARVACSMLVVFAALFLVATLVVILVSLDKGGKA